MSVQPVRMSQRAAQFRPAPISYLIELAVKNPSLISLAAGLVDHATLPVDETQRAIEELFRQRGQSALQYGTTLGDLALRRAIAQRLRAVDGPLPALDPDRIAVGTGSQQLLYLVAELLLNPGDIVLLATPSYFVYLGVLESMGIRVLPIASDGGGMDLVDLERTLTKLAADGELDRVGFIYDVTYFNNPNGLSLAADRRAPLVALARRFSGRHRLLIVEDAAYRELRYDGPDVPSLLTHDPEGQHVLYAGTFSKPFSPGLKCGFAVLPRELIEPLTTLKGHHDFGSSHFIQCLLAEVLGNGGFERQLTVLRATYREKRDALLAALRDHLGHLPGVTWSQPLGGLYVWVEFPHAIETGYESPLFQDCLAAGVLYVPGEFCFPESDQPRPKNGLRLSFGVQSPERIHEGVARLARVVCRQLDNPPPATRALVGTA